ncbi:MAG: helix-turn-helix domain-containing protein [Methylophaga sp.]|nr:helix-turn-helix domain-containing protein [Methylophaga sp.]
MKLSPQHHQAIILLSEGLNNKEVAEKLSVAPETVSRWKADFNFQAELNKVLKANHEAQRDKLRHLSSVALEAIEGVMLDSDTPQRDKLTAAFKVLEIAELKQGAIGSSNPATLQQRHREAELLDAYEF